MSEVSERLRSHSLALRHHFAVHGAGTTVAAVADAGQTAGGHAAIRAAAGRSDRLGGLSGGLGWGWGG